MQKRVPPGAFPPGTKLTVGSHSVAVRKYISEGGFAHVYVVSVNPPTVEGDVACLKRVVVPDKIHLNLLRAEVDAMKRLEGHPNIVRYIDSHAARLSGQGQMYEVLLLMEYCSGHGLIDFMNTRLRDQLTESEILKITYDVTYGLSCMHYLQPPLIHRDLKIENILIAADGTFKLCDFGSVSPVLRPPRNQAEFHILEEDIQRHTTAQYRAPEMVDIYRGFPIDEKSDIWALGVFLYKLCYYTTPFEQEGSLAILQAKFSFPAKPVYSDRLKAVISGLLREDPRARPNVYQVLKEVSTMRGIEVPIKDIFSRPRHEVDSSAAVQQPPQPVAAPGAVRVSPPTETQEKVIPQVTPMYRGRPQTESKSAPAEASIERVSTPVFGDPFDGMDGRNNGRPASQQQPVQLPQHVKGGEDIESRYPSVEELSRGLERIPFNFASTAGPSSTPATAPASAGSTPTYMSRQIQTQTQSANPSARSSFDAPSRPLTASLQPHSVPSTSRSRSPQPPPPPSRGRSPQPLRRAGVTPEPIKPSTASSAAGKLGKPLPPPPKPETVLIRTSPVLSDSSPDSSPDLAVLTPQPRTRQPARSRPVSMYNRVSSYDDDNGRLSSRPTGDDAVDDREQLKIILTGLSRRSSTVLMDTGGNHIDSNVDFLKVLDNDHTGSRHHRKSSHSHSQYLDPANTGDSRLHRSSSTASRRSTSTHRHSKKPSISSFKDKINEKFKMFDGSQSRTPSDSMPPPRTVSSGNGSNSVRMSYRYSQSSDALNELPRQSGRRSADQSSYTDGAPRVKGSIQSRMDMLLNQPESTAPRKTASGYGRYTDAEPREESGERLRHEGERSATPEDYVPRKFEGHTRQLSVISSESSSSSVGARRPPRPQKPSHLQSPRRTQTAQEPLESTRTPIDDDWEVNFNKKYPSLG